MAATIRGFTSGEIKPQPGFNARQSEQGGWVAQHEFAIQAADFDAAQSSFAKGTLLSDLDPSIPSPFDSFLQISEVSLSRVEGDLIFFSVTATGSGTNQFEEGDLGADALPTYNLTGQLVDVPFSKHRKWGALSDTDKTLLGMLIDGLIYYDITDDTLYLAEVVNSKVPAQDQLTAADAKAFAARIQQGQTTYQKSVYTWQESTEGEDQLIAAQLNKLGLIATPRGTPPTPTGTRDWMLTGVSQSQTGELYRTNLEWTLSEEGGHDDFLYDA